MVEPVSTTVMIITALIPLLGLLLKNKWIVLLGAIGFLYVLGLFASLPTYIWIILIIIVFLWIVNQGKGK